MDAMATTEDRTHTHNNNKCLAFYNYPQVITYMMMVAMVMFTS